MTSSFICFDFETGSCYKAQAGLKHNSSLDLKLNLNLKLKFLRVKILGV